MFRRKTYSNDAGGLDAHEKVCVERYGNIWDALKDIKAQMNADRIARATAESLVHERFNTISGRMWAALASVAVAAVSATAAFIFHLLTKGH